MQLRPITDDERLAFVRAVARQFGEALPEQQIERLGRIIELDRTLAAFDGEGIVATTAIESFQMALPGGTAGCAGVTAVGVRTDFRRRGLLTQMMRHAIDQAHDRSEPLAALYASEGAIYGRYGFGPAAPTARYRLMSTEPLLQDPVDDEVKLVDAGEALPRMHGLFDRVLERQPGMLSRSDARWDLLHGEEDPRARVGGGSLPYHAFVGDRGYVVYRLLPGEGDDAPGGTVRVIELITDDNRAYAALWQFLASVDLYPNVDAALRPPDEPLAHMLRDPDRLRSSEYGELWVRVIDVPAALRARRYAVAGELVIEVTDEFCSHNTGRWALSGGPDEATCERTDRSPDVSLDAAALAAAYLGGQRWSTLVRARRVSEHTPGSAGVADAMFASDPLPWNPRTF